MGELIGFPMTALDVISQEDLEDLNTARAMKVLADQYLMKVSRSIAQRVRMGAIVEPGEILYRRLPMVSFA